MVSRSAGEHLNYNIKEFQLLQPEGFIRGPTQCPSANAHTAGEVNRRKKRYVQACRATITGIMET